MRSAKKILLVLGLAPVLALVAGWVIETCWRAVDLGRYGGESFAVIDGARIRYLTLGPPDDGKTVVLLSGLFDVAPDWSWVQTALAPRVRTFSYDRPGTGFSDALPGGADGQAQAAHLKGILRAAGIAPPYVLAGHSIGGSYAIIYAATYPDDVAGLVLLEPVHPDEYARQPVIETDADAEFFLRTRLMRRLAAFSGARWLKPYESFGHGLPEAAFRETAAVNASAHHLAGVVAEIDSLEKTKELQRAIKSLGDLPLAILSAGSPPGAATAAYQQMHREMQALSTRATWEVFADGNHSSIVHDQKGSLRSVALIQEVWEKARRGP